MTELPDYLKEIEKSIVKSAQQNRWLGWGEQTFLFENLPRIIEDFKQLQKDKAEMIKAIDEYLEDGCECGFEEPMGEGYTEGTCYWHEVLGRIKEREKKVWGDLPEIVKGDIDLEKNLKEKIKQLMEKEW